MTIICKRNQFYNCLIPLLKCLIRKRHVVSDNMSFSVLVACHNLLCPRKLITMRGVTSIKGSNDKISIPTLYDYYFTGNKSLYLLFFYKCFKACGFYTFQHSFCICTARKTTNLHRETYTDTCINGRACVWFCCLFLFQS